MWENKLLAGLCVLLLNVSTVRADAPAASGPTRIHKLHYEFWFEPDERGSVRLNSRPTKSASMRWAVPTRASIPILPIRLFRWKAVGPKNCRAGEKRRYTTSAGAITKRAGILYSETQHFTYRFPELKAGDRTVSTTVYAFRESRNLIPRITGNPCRG